MKRYSPVEKARVSDSAKARTKTALDGLPVHSFDTALDNLPTFTPNEVELMERPDSAFLMTARPAKFQTRAFELIRIELGVRIYSPRLNSEVQHLGNLSAGAVQRGPRPLGQNFGPSLPIFGDLARSRCLRRARVHRWHLVCTGACRDRSVLAEGPHVMARRLTLRSMGRSLHRVEGAGKGR